MPGETIVLQVGQCGNQLGWRFWDNVFREFGQQDVNGIYTPELATFFRNTPHVESNLGLAVGKKVSCLKSRSIMIDMEEGVVNQMLASDLGSIFDRGSVLTDVSGSGNNWARGYHEYGAKHREDILDLCCKSLEECERPESFLMFKSLGGGTGSGLGARILEMLKDHFPKLHRVVPVFMPSAVDDVRDG